ncbi:DUF4959 domain-containing protein [Fulvivirgaceae bacterium BMA12]|uniref:DUF4959 domain-containing protein n=1 Tax=Agaribacillus aureus TaxID=3051825 RepID=A0ABT8LB15_9BACT|nr:DUF4959 domain-containing protein [Fulvivirgaceae bacterium BMA12]
MKIRSILYFALLLSGSTLFFQCEEEEHAPIHNDGINPGKITVSEIKSTAGGAVIRYQLPNDGDLLYVEAQYALDNGRKMQVRASVYIDSIQLEGFGSVGTFPVELYAVDRGGNRSEALKVDIETLTPPVETIFGTVELERTFGGVNVQWKNPNKAPIALIMMALPDSLENRVDLDVFETIYSQAPEGNTSLRGFGDVGHKFAVVVRDRWDNLSDTLSVSLTPLLEEELDKLKFKEVILPGDIPAVPPWNPSGGSTMPDLWDGNLFGGGAARLVTTHGDMPDNYYYTFDLGVNVKLSRLKFWQFLWGSDGSEFFYFDAQYERFEVWGASELDASGDFDTWTLLRKCEIIKPSGLPIEKGSFSNEDMEAAFAGHDFEFPLDAPEVRYIRIKVNKTFSNLDWASCGEMSFFGQIND